MLSPGEYHKQVPTDYLKNLRFRSNVLRLCREEPKYRRAAVEACRRDILFYINVFVWQYNPKQLEAEVGPFLTWASQSEAFSATIRRLFADQDDILWEKSRYQGATWMALILFDWCARFHRHKKFLCVSHSEQAVDRSGDPDSLFWKVEFIQKNMPKWMPAAKKSKLKVLYPQTGSTITGAATSERSGVGGRATAVLLDEFSKQREDREILGQTADTGPRLFVGTHYGLGTAFYDLTQRPDMRKIVMHWSSHPDQARGLYRSGVGAGGFDPVDKTYPYPDDYKFVTDGTPTGGPHPGLRSVWYDRECTRRANSRDVAMHLDISPSQSQSQFFDALIIRQLQTGCTDPTEWDLEYDPDHATPIGLRPSPGGPLRLWLSPTSSNAVPRSKYAAGCDVATGLRRTPSICSVADAVTGAKVAEYATANDTPERFAVIVVALCRLFKDVAEGVDVPTLLNWEDKGPGLQFGKTIRELGYKRLCPRPSGSMVRGLPPTELYGWVPGTDSKRRLLDAYRGALYDRAFVNRSEIALEECLHYRYSDKRDTVEHPKDADVGADPSMARSNHGDRVIADALAWMGCQRLGAGIPGKKVEPTPAPPAVGSLRWRMELAERGERGVSNSRPIRRSVARR